MTEITKLIVNERVGDLRREAERAAVRRAAARARRLGCAVSDTPITIRRATEADAAASARLAGLDSAPAPTGPVLLAESHGRLRAARSLRDGATVADPFYRSAAIIDLLVIFGGQASDDRAASRLRPLRGLRKLAVARRRNRRVVLT